MHKQNEPASQECMCWPSVSYPHHHHRHVVCRAPLHCLVGQPVACSFIAGINSRFPFSGLDLFILPKGWNLSDQDISRHYNQGRACSVPNKSPQ